MDKELIIKVIIEDLRYNRLINQLEDVGLVVNPKHHSGLIWVVSKMMGVEDVSDDWTCEYYTLTSKIYGKIEDQANHIYQRLQSI